MDGDEVADIRRCGPKEQLNERLRAELVRELGFSPGTLDDAEIDRHRRLNAALEVAPTMERVHAKYGHLREHKRRLAVEEQARIEVADLPRDSHPWDDPGLPRK